MPVFRIHHITRYAYDKPVTESMNALRIFPAIHPGQEILQHDLQITHDPEVFTFSDYWGNKTGIFNLLPQHRELVIDSRMIVRTTNPAQIQVNFNSGFGELAREVAGNFRLLELIQKDNISSEKEILGMARSILSENNSVAMTVENCCTFIFKYFKYIKGITDVETTVDELLEHRAGVCQDFAHLMLQMLRTLDIPCRYVSGYICPNKNGMRGEGATHAWVEVWIPAYGWAGIDPTNNVWTTNTHVKLATGRNFKDCTPAKGTFRGPARQSLSVFVSVGYENGHTIEEHNQVTTRFSDHMMVGEQGQSQQ